MGSLHRLPQEHSAAHRRRRLQRHPIMAIQEHPYYGSFGYHVSNFFAASSRFGTPDELKALIDEAHRLGIACNHGHRPLPRREERERGHRAPSTARSTSTSTTTQGAASTRVGLAVLRLRQDGGAPFPSLNCKYWMEEYHFDGFRFDGVTSMLYYDHGRARPSAATATTTTAVRTPTPSYTSPPCQHPHPPAQPRAITIAEEMSGMPGLASSLQGGGIGFDYRMAMGIPTTG